MHPKRILILGNSITRHRPKPDIGWTDDWGMAASTPDKDYVHLLLAQLAIADGGNAPESLVENIAPFERDYTSFDIPGGFQKYAAFKADCVVLAIGENITRPVSSDDEAALRNALSTVVTIITKQCTPAIFVRSCFWADTVKDTILRLVCDDFHGTFIDISSLHKNEANFARAERAFSDNGVANHPGDAGMKAIAASLCNAIIKQKG